MGRKEEDRTSASGFARDSVPFRDSASEFGGVGLSKRRRGGTRKIANGARARTQTAYGFSVESRPYFLLAQRGRSATASESRRRIFALHPMEPE